MIAWGLVDMFWTLIYVVSVFVIMFMLNAQLAFIITMIVPCIALLTVYCQNRILKWNRKISEIIGDKMDVVCLHMLSLIHI